MIRAIVDSLPAYLLPLLSPTCASIHLDSLTRDSKTSSGSVLRFVRAIFLQSSLHWGKARKKEEAEQASKDQDAADPDHPETTEVNPF